MSIHPAFTASLPAVFIDRPMLYMATVSSFMLVSLLCLEWLWRLFWSMWERPAKRREPATAARMIHVLLVLSIFFRVAPYLVLIMTWPDISPASRLWLSSLEITFRAGSFLPFLAAWLLAGLSGPIITYQLAREPIPLHLWPTWRQAQRPLKIGAGVAIISFALTYLR